MTLEIIGAPRSNFVRAVRMVAEEKGVAYALIPERPHADAVTQVNPLGLIPVMRDDGLEIAESQAIARYIDDAYDGPRLIPAEPRAAAPINQWVARVATSVDRLLMRNYVVEYAFHKDEDGNVVRSKIDRAIKRFPAMFALLEAGVAPGCLGSASFTMADCFLVPILAAVQNYPEGKEAIAGSEALAGYFTRMSERASFQATAG